MAGSLNVVFTGKPLVWYDGAVNATAGTSEVALVRSDPPSSRGVSFIPC